MFISTATDLATKSADKAEIKDLRSFRVVYSAGSLNIDAGIPVAGPACSTVESLHQKALGEPTIRSGVKGIGIFDGDARRKTGMCEFAQGIILDEDVIDFASFKSKVLDAHVTPNNHVEVRHTRPGLYAVAHYIGPWGGLKAFYGKMLDQMIPATGHEYNGEPVLELYQKTDGPSNLVEVCFPVT